MPDWDADSARLAANLSHLLREIYRRADARAMPTVEIARDWQTAIMAGLDVPKPEYVGAFRGESGLERLQVRIAGVFGTPAAKVAEDLARFEAELQTRVTVLDAYLPVGREPSADEVEAVLELCAWAHAEWVRIHPLPNGNGRTARLWANFLAVRYGLPAFVRLRPRPGTAYEEASARAMAGEWQPTAEVFCELLDDYLSQL